ncbi:hypothetical protein U0070_014043 [Myodes glareolus]|uniref:FBA domain-containing protein n=1 Tax=Myodes glareolus TaxID=447135 RepID=A0AAW0HL21_MYOGA
MGSGRTGGLCPYRVRANAFILPRGFYRGLQSLRGGAQRERLGHGKESDSGSRASLPDLLHDFFQWGTRENCGCIYRLQVRLLDEYENEVVKFSASPSPVSHVFVDFGKGIRYVSLEQYGRDIHSWVGHYGVTVACSSVWVRIRLS